MYRQLTDKVDAFFARVAARHPDDLRCAAGCDLCCRTRLTVTAVEADAIAAHVRALPPAERGELAGLAARPHDPAAPRCAALDDAGRCRIYAARPIVCRSHGVPVRIGDTIDACRLNFTARGPTAADPDCVLDQTTLSATLLAVDRAHGGGPRRELAELLVEVTA
jgi:Fe-S-cluster containining protein